MQAVLQQELINKPVIVREPDRDGRKIGLLTSLFGCWHKSLSRPMSDNHSTYQTCVECGARRRFDTKRFTSSGPFYYPADARRLPGVTV